MREALYEYTIVDEWSPLDGETGEIRAFSVHGALEKLRKKHNDDELWANIRLSKNENIKLNY